MRSLGGMLAVLALLGACTGGGGGDSTGAVVASDSVDSFIGSVCDLDATCCTKLTKTYDGATCRSQLSQLAVGKTYDAAKGQACLNEIQAAGDGYCSTGSQTPTCLAVFGSGPSSGAAQGADCVGTVGYDGISLAPAGPVCFATDNLYCDQISKKCLPRGGLGTACQTFSSSECTNEFRCDVEKGTCIAQAAAGQPCSPAATSWALTCGPNLICQNDICASGNSGGAASDVSRVACK